MTLFILIILIAIWAVVSHIHLKILCREQQKEMRQLKKALVCCYVLTREQIRTYYMGENV